MNSSVIRYLFLAIILGIFQWGCRPDCPPSRDYKMTIDSFSFYLNQMDFSNDTLAIEKPGELRFSIVFRGNQQFVHLETPFNWGSAAYALEECRGNIFIGLTQELDSISIYSNQDYASIPAGNSLNDLFEWHTVDKSQNTSWDWYSMTHMIQAMKSGNTISKGGFYESAGLDLRIANAPKTQEPIRVSVDLFLKKGTILTSTSGWFRVE